jgi:hypothetical protein
MSAGQSVSSHGEFGQRRGRSCWRFRFDGCTPAGQVLVYGPSELHRSVTAEVGQITMVVFTVDRSH